MNVLPPGGGGGHDEHGSDVGGLQGGDFDFDTDTTESLDNCTPTYPYTLA